MKTKLFILLIMAVASSTMNAQKQWSPNIAKNVYQVMEGVEEQDRRSLTIFISLDKQSKKEVLKSFGQKLVKQKALKQSEFNHLFAAQKSMLVWDLYNSAISMDKFIKLDNKSSLANTIAKQMTNNVNDYGYQSWDHFMSDITPEIMNPEMPTTDMFADIHQLNDALQAFSDISLETYNPFAQFYSTSFKGLNKAHCFLVGAAAVAGGTYTAGHKLVTDGDINVVKNYVQGHKDVHENMELLDEIIEENTGVSFQAEEEEASSEYMDIPCLDDDDDCWELLISGF